MRNDGSWEPKPSGLKHGNLHAWRNMMFEACPEPKIDDIIIDKTTGGEIIGYLCTLADGYNSYWTRVAKSIESIQKVVRNNRGTSQPQQQAAPRYPQPSAQACPAPQSVFFTKRAKDLDQNLKNPNSLYSAGFENYDDDIPF